MKRGVRLAIAETGARKAAYGAAVAERVALGRSSRGERFAGRTGAKRSAKRAPVDCLRVAERL